MVRVILFSVLMVVSLQSNGQYIGDTITIEDYTGEWKWETENESFTLYLRDTLWKFLPGNEKMFHAVVGTYKYIKDGITIIDNTDIFLKPSRMPIYGWANPAETDSNGNIWSLKINFKELDTKKESDSDNSYLRYSLGRYAPQLTMHLAGKYIWFDGIENQISALTGESADSLRAVSLGCRRPFWQLPNNITFTKVVE